MPDIKLINEELKNLSTNLRGLPLYRLVWGPEQTEIRIGIFNDFSESGLIYLRTCHESREVRKYSTLPPCWILEKWHPPEECYNPEIPLSREGSYEPLWCFLDQNNEPLEPNLRVVNFIAKADFKGLNKTTPQERMAYFDMLEEKEEQYFRDALDTNALLSQFHQGEAIIVPENYDKVNK